MREFVLLGLSKPKPKQLNQARIYFQVLFLSDILGASGKMLDINSLGAKYVRADAFPLENPTYPVTYVEIVQTTTDVKQYQPSNHGNLGPYWMDPLHLTQGTAYGCIDRCKDGGV